jgi:hypothetical protein
MENKKQKETRLDIEIARQMLTLATSGFALVAALAWNSLIQDLVNNYIKKWFPQGGSLLSLFIYAVVVTILAVIITLQLSKILQKFESKE